MHVGSKKIFTHAVSTLMCTDVALSVFTLVISLIGELVAVIARATDEEYNRDIGPEVAIAFGLLISVYVFARMINSTLKKRRIIIIHHYLTVLNWWGILKDFLE